MNFARVNLSPLPNTRPLTASSVSDRVFANEERKQGFGARLRQTVKAVGKKTEIELPTRYVEPDLSGLTSQSQVLILRAVDAIRKEDSEKVMHALDESRDILKSSFEEFKREQEEYRQQLDEIAKSKDSNSQRRTENAIPISALMRHKHDGEGQLDPRVDSAMNPTYQAHFDALLAHETNTQQHATDKAAVVKYIRRRERRKRAEENKKNYELADDVLERQTADLMQKIGGMDMKLEHERDRQNEILRARMNEKKMKTNSIQQAHEIIGQANEADLVRQRYEQSQREKIEARLSAARQHRPPSHPIHVQSRSKDQHTNGHDEGDDDDAEMNEEQRTRTKQSLQLLNENDGYRTVRDVVPVFGDEADGTRKRVANIEI